jgi:metallophosphoesterase (TIGR00282 family)
LDRLIRPVNYPEGVLGMGYRIDLVKEIRVCTINLMGRVFLSYGLDCPFRKMDWLLDQLKDQADIFLVDFHAEVTSEKKAMGYYLDGRVAAVIGTHTHVPTADARVLPKGTGYLTDVGMVGALDSVLGMNKNIALDRFLHGINERFEVAEGGSSEFGAVYLEINTETQRTEKIESIYREVEL